MSRVLVTGGSGFVGSHLCDALLADGHEVWALDDLSTGTRANVQHLADHRRFHLVVGSVLGEAYVSELVDRCDQVYHLAAAVGVRLIVDQPVHTLVTNLRGTEVVLEHCARLGKRVFLASTSEVYGDRQEAEALAEDARRVYGPPTERRWAYAESKALDEFLALAYRDERGLDCVIGRLFNTVGPRQTGAYGMVVPRFVEAALKGEPLVVYGDGEQTRCFCHVEDVVHALRLIMADGSDIYNVGSTESVSINELARRVVETVGSSSEIEHLPYAAVFDGMGLADMRHRKPDIRKVQALGWQPARSLRDILWDVAADCRRKDM